VEIEKVIAEISKYDTHSKKFQTKKMGALYGRP
jgi:hypothetical protein